jgi:MCP family monocarboxylic acid transporter-like MFS transporter 10
MLINLIGSTQCFVVLFFSFVTGRLLDANYSRVLLVTGSIIITIGMFMLSVCNGNGGLNQGNYGLTWLTQGLVVGLGMACFFVSR